MEVILPLMALALMVAVGVGLIFVEAGKIEDQALVQAGARLGLRVLGGGRLAGVYQGIGVTVTKLTSDARDPTIEVRCSVPHLLPSGFTLSPERPSAWRSGLPGPLPVAVGEPLGTTYWCQAENVDGAQEIVDDPEFRRQLIGLRGGRLTIEDHVLTLSRVAPFPEHVPVLLDAGVALVCSVDAVTRAAWARVAERHGLVLEEDERGRRLIGGPSLRRFEVREVGGPLRLDVRAEVWPPLPPGTHVTAPSGRGVSEALQDPVLDGHLTTRTSDIAALRARLVRDDVRGALLEVLNFHADSVLTAHELRVVATGRSERRLTAVIDAVLALLTALDDDQPPT